MPVNGRNNNFFFKRNFTKVIFYNTNSISLCKKLKEDSKNKTSYYLLSLYNIKSSFLLLIFVPTSSYSFTGFSHMPTNSKTPLLSSIP